MKQGSTQFGVRKNPDSPRVHGLRLAAAEQIVALAGHVMGSKPGDLSIAAPYVAGEHSLEERTN